MKNRSISHLLVTASLLALLGHANHCNAALQNRLTEQEEQELSRALETQNQLTDQEKKELAQMLAQSKKQKIEVPGLKSHRKLSKYKQQALEKLVDQSQKAITPLLKQEVKTLLNSKRYQANLETGKPLALQALGFAKEAADKPKNTPSPEGQVVVFVSASVPLPTLRNYAKALEKISGALILRGAIQGLKKIGPTLAFSQQVLKIDPHCTNNCSLRNVPVLIDPLLFRRHHIAVVPAIAFQPEGIVSGCAPDPSAPAGDVVYGDVSLHGAMETLQRNDPHPILKNLLKQLENEHAAP